MGKFLMRFLLSSLPILHILFRCCITHSSNDLKTVSPENPKEHAPEAEYEPKCKTMPGNNEHDCSKHKITFQKQVSCRKCTFNREEYLRCYSIKHMSVSTILTSIPFSTKGLLILYDNTWLGTFPLQPDPIDLHGISNLRNLTYFQITRQSKNYYQLYPLLASEGEFAKLRHLQKLAITIPITTTDCNSVINITSSLKRASMLDLSYTRGIGLSQIEELFRNPNLQSLNQICLSQFQTPGHEGYRNRFSIFKNLSIENITLSKLYELDLSHNMLTNVAPGISQIFPNLKLIDLSGNLLIDPYNFGILFESIMHPSIQIFNYQDQGFKYYNKQPQRQHLKEVLCIEFFFFQKM